jgi:tyrosyl-tRNA synthetase
MAKSEEKIEHLLSRNVESVIEREHLRARLIAGKKLRIKHGIDPTGPNMHIGRAIVLWKLKEFQELGHTIVLIIGDMTAQIGDPSDKLEKRPFLSRAQVEENMKAYLPQIGKILDLKKTEIRYNSEWLSKLGLREISELADNFSFQQILERRNFQDRWQKHEEISFREGMYPLLQGYDSVAVKADVEIGGADQLFNVLAGRKVQERYGEKPQDIMVTKMLIGLDGRKMSTSWGNVINIVDSPEEQFGKVMSLRDELIPEYFEAATELSEGEIAEIKKELKQGTNPKLLKEQLASEIVQRYYGGTAAKKARENFEKIFSKREMPEDLPALKLDGKKLSALEIVIAAGTAKSRSDARRLIEQGGFAFGEENITDPLKEIVIRGGETIRVGKKHFFRATI